MQEIEVKFLDVDPDVVEKKLLALGAKKEFDAVFEEWIFQKPEWKETHGRVRVRIENGRVQVAYKETINKTSDGNTEIELPAYNPNKIKAPYAYAIKMEGFGS